MTQYAVAIDLPDQAATEKLYTTIRHTAGGLGVTTIVVVKRDDDGTVTVVEGDPGDIGSGFFGGSVIGMLVGVLGGPIGVLLGATAGAATGALFDASKADDADDVITEFAQRVPTGKTAIIAETNEADTTALDAVVKEAGGTILRRPLGEVLAELEAQQQAADDAARAARAALRDKRKQERHEKVEDRIDALKKKFHLDK